MKDTLKWLASFPVGKIVSNIPIPPRGETRGPNSARKTKRSVFRKMNNGDFIKVPTKDAMKWYCIAHELGKTEGFAPVRRKLNNKFSGIWKVNRKG